MRELEEKKNKVNIAWVKWNLVCYSDNEETSRFITYMLANRLKMSEAEAINMGEKLRADHHLVIGEYIREIAMTYKNIFEVAATKQEIELRIQIEPQE